jgi:hypothetical protein
MTKFKVTVIILLFTGFVSSACNRNIVASKTPKQYYYSCPMHPSDIYYSSGNCPKCGMALEQWEMDDYSPKKASSSHSGHSSSGSQSGGCH